MVDIPRRRFRIGGGEPRRSQRPQPLSADRDRLLRPTVPRSPSDAVLVRAHSAGNNVQFLIREITSVLLADRAVLPLRVFVRSTCICTSVLLADRAVLSLRVCVGLPASVRLAADNWQLAVAGVGGPAHASALFRFSLSFPRLVVYDDGNIWHIAYVRQPSRPPACPPARPSVRPTARTLGRPAVRRTARRPTARPVARPPE